MTPKRLLALAAIACALVGLAAAPAFGHATLVTTDPQPGASYDDSPRVITLGFTESVEVPLGSIRLYDSRENRIDIGAPRHPEGDGKRVRSSLPDLDDGVYVVTWRVISADAHPVQGAFTFQVGEAGSLSGAEALLPRLLASQGGSTVVGVVYAVDRVAIFVTLALLIGGIVFLAVLFPQGRDAARARVIVWTAWIGAVAATIAGIAVEGVYAAGLPLTKVFEPSVVGDVLETRYGRVAVVRLVLLALTYPLLRMLLRQPADARPLPRWWLFMSGLAVVGLSLTPGIAGHAGTGDYVWLAIPADAVHVLAMSCWLGGLVLLLAVVLVRTDPGELRQGINRFSALALGAISALVATGAFQAWRQVGSFTALRDTDYGRLLIAKLVAFAALVIAAAFSREVVNRRFRATAPVGRPGDAGVARHAPAVPAVVGAPGGSGPHPPPLRNTGGGGHDWAEDAVDDWPEDDDETEVRRLRRSVAAEVVIAVVVLAITALLVNTAPARTVETGPISMTLRSEEVWADVVIAPGAVGGNDIHVTAIPMGDTITPVEDMSVQLRRAGSDLAPFDVPLRNLGPGHYLSPLFEIPFAGDWQMIVRVRLGPTDEAVLTGSFTLR